MPPAVHSNLSLGQAHVSNICHAVVDRHGSARCCEFLGVDVVPQSSALNPEPGTLNPAQQSQGGCRTADDKLYASMTGDDGAEDDGRDEAPRKLAQRLRVPNFLRLLKGVEGLSRICIGLLHRVSGAFMGFTGGLQEKLRETAPLLYT